MSLISFVNCSNLRRTEILALRRLSSSSSLRSRDTFIGIAVPFMYNVFSWNIMSSITIGIKPISKKLSRAADIWVEIWEKWGNYENLGGNFCSASEDCFLNKAAQWTYNKWVEIFSLFWLFELKNCKIWVLCWQYFLLDYSEQTSQQMAVALFTILYEISF